VALPQGAREKVLKALAELGYMTGSGSQAAAEYNFKIE
jgi:hypothetical protein